MSEFITDLRYVYVTRDTDPDNQIGVWDTNVGIRKEREESHVLYFSAAQYEGGDFMAGRAGTFVFDYECKEVFGYVPNAGTAWLVNTTTGKWERVDKDMYLVDRDGEIIE